MKNNEQSFVKLLQRDITTMECDVIVNSANPGLGGIGPELSAPGGGVDGAIHRAAGIRLYELCQSFPSFPAMYNGTPTRWRCKHGDLRVTDGFALSCRKVFHAVAPIYEEGKSGELEMLYHLYHRIFSTLVQMDLRTIALPPLGTRTFLMPKAESSAIAVRNAFDFAEVYHMGVYFCVIDDQERAMYRENCEAP